jgi:hypothetical protein
MKLIDIINTYPNKDWYYPSLAANPSISYQDFLSFPIGQQYWEKFCQNPNITIDIVKDNLNRWQGWSWMHISENKGITFQDIINNSQLPWNWSTISLNPNITLPIVLENPNYPWNWNNLATNMSISLKEILDNPELPWKDTSMRDMRYRKDITLDFIQKKYGKDKNLDDDMMYSISTSSGITLQDILNNPRLGWQWDFVIENPNISWTDVLNNPRLYRNRKDYPNIALSTVLENRDIEWNWRNVSSSPSITWDDVLSHIDLPWNWVDLSQKPILKKWQIANKMINDTIGLHAAELPAEILAQIYSYNYDTTAFSLYELIELIKPINKRLEN